MSWFSFSFSYAVRPEFVIDMQRFPCCTRRTDQFLSYERVAKVPLVYKEDTLVLLMELQSLLRDIKPITGSHFLPSKKKSRVQPENPYYILNVHRLQLEILVFNSSHAAGTSDAVSPINELAIILHDYMSILHSRYSIHSPCTGY